MAVKTKLPKKSNRPQTRKVAKKPAFLAAFVLTASLTDAAKACGLDRSNHYDWLRSDPAYAEAFEAARAEAAQSLEDEAVRRAREGVLKPVFYQGRRCGTERVYSDGLMQFLLRGFMPAKYRNVTEIQGRDGGPIESEHRVVFVTAKAA